MTVHQIYEEGIWPESRTGLIPPFDQGRYVLKVYDAASNRLIFLRGFDTMYAEYKTTSPALAGDVRVFERSVRIPLPKRPVLFVVEKRDKRNLLHPVFDRIIDPADYHIVRETPASGDAIFEIQVKGDPHDKVDFVFVAEGYVGRGPGQVQGRRRPDDGVPLRHRALQVPEGPLQRPGRLPALPEKGVDEPRQRAYRKTALDASFNAFDLDRYLLIEEDHRMHEMAGQVPYDALIVLVDSPRYGGGSIAFDYCVTHGRSRPQPRGLRPRARPFLRRARRRVLPVRGLLQRFLSQGDRAPRAQHHRPARSGPRQVAGPAFARDRGPDRVRQGPDRSAPGRAAGDAGRPGQGRRSGQEAGRGGGGAEEDRGQGRSRGSGAAGQDRGRPEGIRLPGR
ncbi:MAG: M64 family metallopeptidase [Candidatus Moduliflexus flocculans]|nr:M64 family metallopeptidase [Candidatus Moduliflexus flocculans]